MEKKKRPIYLWVLLVLSGVFSLLGVVGLLSPSQVNEEQIRSVYSQVNLSAEAVNQLVAYLKEATAVNQSLLVSLLVVLEFLLVAVAFFFFFKREIAKANYSYLSYLVLKLLGVLYSFVMSTGLANRYLQDSQARSLMMFGFQIVSIVLFILYACLIALIIYKIWRQNQALEED